MEFGGIGAIHQVSLQSGLIDAINDGLHMLKNHVPYWESDHVLNIAYNIHCGGTCLEDLERLRNDETYLNALGAERIPDPTTAGDFCRRFDSEEDVEMLMDCINSARLGVWAGQDESFFEQAVLDVDGTLAPTTGECKEGMDVAYNGVWGYHPLVVSLANTGEPLYLENRSGNRPSHEGAWKRIDQAIELCQAGGFKRILIRGDTDFSQTEHLDRWDGMGSVTFIFGIDAMANLVETASELGEKQWDRLKRPPRYKVKTKRRRRPDNVRESIVQAREYKNIRLEAEHVAEFKYSPTKCKKTYRIVVVRKNLSVEEGQHVLFKEVRYFFYITNDLRKSKEKIVYSANDRCNQENLIEQLKNGVKAMKMPTGDLLSNWAYLVMASLAWTLKAWFALSLPEKGRWASKYKAQKQEVLQMEFKRFINAFVRIPCQIVRSGRKIIYRLLSWNPWQEILLRYLDTQACLR